MRVLSGKKRGRQLGVLHSSFGKGRRCSLRQPIRELQNHTLKAHFAVVVAVDSHFHPNSKREPRSQGTEGPSKGFGILSEGIDKPPKRPTCQPDHRLGYQIGI